METRTKTRLVMLAIVLAICSAYYFATQPPPVDVQTEQPPVENKPIDLATVTYRWDGDMIKTSDGRSFAIKRENLVDEKGKPILILEARSTDQEATKAQSRSDMDEADLTKDFWLRIQDQDLGTLELVPSKFDNAGDLRRVYVTITDSEMDFLKLSNVDMYRIKDNLANKIAVPIWMVLKAQQRIQEAPIKSSLKTKVKDLRKSEIPN